MIVFEAKLRCDKCPAKFTASVVADSLETLTCGDPKTALRLAAGCEGWVVIEDVDFCGKCKPEEGKYVESKT